MANTPNPIINPLSHLTTDPVRNFKFLVSISPVTGDATNWTATNGGSFGTLGFVSVGGLSVTTEPIAYREGGYNTNVHQLPGQSSFTPITLSRGILLGTDQNMNWMKRLFSVLTPGAKGAIGSEFRVNVDIQVLSHPNPAGYTGSDGDVSAAGPEGQHTSMRFRVYNAWITNLSYSNLDAGANSLMVEEMTLVHEGFDVHFADNLKIEGSAKPF